MQANKELWNPNNSRDYPALILFSLDPNVDLPTLKGLALISVMLKGTSQSDPDLRVMAYETAHERYTPDRFVEVPESVAHMRGIYFAELMIHRKLLSQHRIACDLRIAVYLRGKTLHTIRHVGEWPDDGAAVN